MSGGWLIIGMAWAMEFADCQALAQAEAHSETAACFVSVADASPGSHAGGIARFNAGYYQLMAGATDEALASLSAFVDAHPTAEEVPVALAWIAREQEKRQPGSGLSTFETLATQHPEHPEAEHARMNAARLRAARGDHLEAARWYEAYVTHHPDAFDRAEVVAAAAAAYRKAGKERAARKVERLLGP
jgi:outer membrane protein assembly factor BamD (BamD/ComL family)